MFCGLLKQDPTVIYIGHQADKIHNLHISAIPLENVDRTTGSYSRVRSKEEDAFNKRNGKRKKVIEPDQTSMLFNYNRRHTHQNIGEVRYKTFLPEMKKKN